MSFTLASIYSCHTVGSSSSKNPSPTPTSASEPPKVVYGDCPSNFEVSRMWRPSVMSAIEEELNPDSRNEIVHDLVVHMYAFANCPSPKFCREAASKLVVAYPFMKDSGKGRGYVCLFLLSCYHFKVFDILRDHGKNDRESQQLREGSG